MTRISKCVTNMVRHHDQDERLGWCTLSVEGEMSKSTERIDTVAFPRTSVLLYHSCFLGVIAIFCNDVQILQCLASQAI